MGKKVKTMVFLTVCGVVPVMGKKSFDNKPNIIFILTDDHRSDALGYAGNSIIHTPEMDYLASQGTYFKNAFVTTPISAASRASILTGMYERTHCYTFEQGNLREPFIQLLYPKILRENGYYTGFLGKLGVEIPGFNNFFDQVEVYDKNDAYKDRRGYFYKTILNDTVHLTRYTGYKAQEFIKSAPADKPFCLSLSFSAPHAHDSAPEQYFWQKKSEKNYENTQFQLPVLSEDDYFFRLPKEVRNGFNRVRWHWRYDTAEKYQRSMKGYYRMITEIDDELGKLRKLLEERNLDRNTIIIIMGDNGLFTGERQLAGKWLMYDVSLRVPLIIYDPTAKQHRDIEDMALNIDIPYTILVFAGITAPESYQGINLQDFVKKGKSRHKRNFILFEHLWDFPQIPSSEAIRTNRWKYIRFRYIKAPEELYDLKTDPDERNNLAGRPEYVQVILKLRREMNEKINKYASGSPVISTNKKSLYYEK